MDQINTSSPAEHSLQENLSRENCSQGNPSADNSLQEMEKRIGHFCCFGIGSLIYAVFYTFCLYRNPSGITFPFFIGGTLFYFLLFLKKSGISAKKDTIFYVTALMLLGISNFCTDDGSILFWNGVVIFVLFFCFMIHSLYDDESWDLSQYLSAVVRTVFGAVGSVGRPFSDLGLYLKFRKESRGLKDGKGRYIVFGLLLCIPLLMVVLFLLGSADMVFASLMEDVMKNIRIPDHLFGVFFTLAFAFFASYCVIAYLAKRSIPAESADRRTGEPVLAITVTFLLSAVYVIFSGIQIVFLFFGKTELPDGRTYAEYARQGFFQLLFVCVINLSLVLICLKRFEESRVLKILLTLISLCTYVMIASSAMRMILYMKYYYLTFLRIFVLWALAVIFLLMTGVLVNIYRARFPLFRYGVLTVTVLYIALSFSHPDYLIARVNTSYMLTGVKSEFFENTGRYPDVDYLKNLSADAAPVLLALDRTDFFENSLRLTEDGNDVWWFSQYASGIKEKYENMNARCFNLSRFRAGRLLKKAGSVNRSAPDQTSSDPAGPAAGDSDS